MYLQNFVAVVMPFLINFIQEFGLKYSAIKQGNNCVYFELFHCSCFVKLCYFFR